MKKFLLLCQLMVILILTSCTQISLNRIEIEKLFIVRAIAIDSLEEDRVRITLLSKITSNTPSQQPNESTKSGVITAEGSTIFEAIRNLLAYADKKPHYGHTEYVFFGEETARKGILPYLDFISRNHEFRYNMKLYIVHGDTAQNLINKTISGDMFIGDKISNIEENMDFLSNTIDVTLSEALYIFDKKNVSTYIPCIRTFKGELRVSQNIQEDLSTPIISLGGYAVFKEDKLQDFILGSRARAINWVKNNIKSGVIVVNAPDGKKVSLEILNSNTKIVPYIDENGLQCTIKVNLQTGIAETMSKVNIFKESTLHQLEKLQEKEVEEEIESLIKYAQEQNLDMFAILTSFIMKYPAVREDLAENWQELFPEIHFKVEVNSNILRTYILREATGSKEYLE